MCDQNRGYGIVADGMILQTHVENAIKTKQTDLTFNAFDN